MATITQPRTNLTATEARGEVRWGEWLIENLIRLAGLSTIVIIGLIFFFLVREGLPAFLDIPLRQLFSSRWYPIESLFGMAPLLVGSFLVTIGAVLISVPLGVTTAIYLGEIAPPWQREILKPLIEMLAGIPSIVLGFLGWVALAPLVQNLGAPTGLTAFTGSLIRRSSALPKMRSMPSPKNIATARWRLAPPSGRPSGGWSCQRRAPGWSSPLCWASVAPLGKRWPYSW